MSWWETLHLVTWWKRLGISAIKTGQDAPSWIWCTERLSFFGGGHIVLQRFVHVRCHFQPLPTKLVFAYFDRGSYSHIYIYIYMCNTIYVINPPKVFSSLLGLQLITFQVACCKSKMSDGIGPNQRGSTPQTRTTMHGKGEGLWFTSG